MTFKLTIYISIFILVLTACGAIGGCAFSSADIQNQTDKDIYVVISFDSTSDKNEVKELFLRFEGTKLSDIVDEDVVHNIKTYRIKSKGNLTLYEGPRSEPKLFLKSLKIITEKVITEYKNTNELADALENKGTQNSLIIK